MEQRGVRTLRITDYGKSKAFYIEGLGFVIDWEHRFEPHLPVVMQVSRDGMAIYPSQHAGDCQVGGLVHFYVANVDGRSPSFKAEPLQCRVLRARASKVFVT